MNIYVGNLPYTVTDESLRDLFIEYGQVDSAKIIMDRHSGRSKGYGFVEMPSNSEADKAIKALNGKLIDGINIKVNQANPGGKKPTRPAFRNRY
jgi:RNA recognition motif-containing protein